jgi:hypothetical protein
MRSAAVAGVVSAACLLQAASNTAEMRIEAMAGLRVIKASLFVDR